MRIAIAGAGRMGQALAETVDAADDLVLAGVWRRGSDLGSIAADADVLVDFSLPGATPTVTAAVIEHGTRLVCGVSGLGEGEQAAIAAAAERVAVVYDRNMSLGIAVLDKLVRDAAVALGPGFGVEIHETHHVHKLDAPSGTALKLAEAVADSAGIDPAAIDFESERRGDVPGDHKVVFSSATETVSLGHSVTTRQVFVDGALRAARWVAGQKPGLYQMRNVLS